MAQALVGTARALADGGKYAWVYDVCVRPAPSVAAGWEGDDAFSEHPR